MLRVSQLLLALASAAAAAAAPCPEEKRGTLQEWLCYGEAQYASRIEGEDDIGARFVLFANGERLYEKRHPAGGTKTKLMLADYTLYRGLDREDSTNIGNHDPFLFFEFALMAPFVALAASGAEPDELPSGVTLVSYSGDGRAAELMRELGVRSVNGNIQRTGAEYRFAANSVVNAPSGALLMTVRGRWSADPLRPYPDSMPLEGWRYHCAPTGPDVRGNHHAVPAGVTLGDVRRGWKGPCE